MSRDLFNKAKDALSFSQSIRDKLTTQVIPQAIENFENIDEPTDPNDPMSVPALGLADMGGGMAGTVKKVAPKVTNEALEALYTNANNMAKKYSFKDLNITPEIGETMERVKKGVNKSFSKLPIFLKRNSEGRLDVEDGKHRLSEAFLRGETDIMGFENEALYRQLVDHENSLTTQRVSKHVKNQGETEVDDYTRRRK